MERNAPQATGTTPNWSGGFRRRVPFYILLAILLSLVSAVLTFFYLEDLRARSIPSLTVVVALRDIRPGTIITVDDVGLQEAPQGIVPTNHMQDVDRVVGRSSIATIHEKEVILSSDLAGVEQSSLSDRIPDGRWAMILPAAWLVSPVPTVREGDRLDLMAYLAGQSREELGLVVSAVECIGFAPGSDQAEYLTLAVTQEEAKAILFARANGYSLLVLLRPAGG
jgi:Flp pilus assembly protein CpaB